MATVKLVLRKKKNKEGKQPLAIRITKDRKTSFVHVGHLIFARDWDEGNQRVKKSHPSSERLNNYLLKKVAEVNNKALEMETETTDVSARKVRQKIKPTGGSTFFPQAELYLANLKSAGKYNRYTADKPRISHFREFLKGSDISFSDITVSLLNRFQTFLKSEYKIGERTIVNHLVVIRSVFSQAMKDNITERKYYPFGKDKIRIKFPDSIKIGLTMEEVKQLETVELPEGSVEHHARNLWLFSFYLAGMRISDVLRLKWNDMQDDRLYYAMGKNAKGGSLKIPQKALAIIAQYKDGKRSADDFIFPDLKQLEDLKDTFILQRRIAHTTSRLDKFLRKHVAPTAKIDKKLTMHIARHTFGNISGDKIPIQMLQKLYRHSHITTTVNYQANFMFKDTDDALEQVIGG